jgi:hypothetical protein
MAVAPFAVTVARTRPPADGTETVVATSPGNANRPGTVSVASTLPDGGPTGDTVVGVLCGGSVLDGTVLDGSVAATRDVVGVACGADVVTTFGTDVDRRATFPRDAGDVCGCARWLGCDGACDTAVARGSARVSGLVLGAPSTRVRMTQTTATRRPMAR